MRSKEEVNEAIARMKAEKPHVPEYNAFGENNHEKIDASIKALEEGWDYMDDLEEIQDEEGWDDCVVEHMNEALNFNEGYGEIDDLLWYPETDYREVEAPEVAPMVQQLAPPTEKKEARLCNKKTCGDCPFSNKSMPGFLADYAVEDFAKYQQAEMNFPCHKHMVGGDMSAIEAHVRVDNGEMPLCRGYVESMIKSGIQPKSNTTLMEAIEIAKLDGLNDNTMSIEQFREFHDLKKLFAK